MTEKPPHIHVAIKSFEHKYWEDIAALFQCPRCNWGTLQLPYQSKDDIKKKLENPPQGMHRLIAVLPEEDTAIGMLGIHPSYGRRAHAAYLLARSWRTHCKGRRRCCGVLRAALGREQERGGRKVPVHAALWRWHE